MARALWASQAGSCCAESGHNRQASGVGDPGNGDVGDPGDDRVGDGSRRYTCDPNSGAGGTGILGQASGFGDPGNGGVRDKSRRCTRDSNDGDGARRYTHSATVRVIVFYFLR